MKLTTIYESTFGNVAKGLATIYGKVALQTLGGIVNDIASQENMRMSSQEPIDEIAERIRQAKANTSDPREKAKFDEYERDHMTYLKFIHQQEKIYGSDIEKMIEMMTLKLISDPNSHAERSAAEQQIMRQWNPAKIDPDLPRFNEYQEKYNKYIISVPELKDDLDRQLKDRIQEYSRAKKPIILARLHFYQEVLYNISNR